METYYSSEDREDLSLSCTILVHDENRLGSGTIWGFYPSRCHVESDLPISPGMMISLSLHIPGAAGLKIERGQVKWSCHSEFGLQFMPKFF